MIRGLDSLHGRLAALYALALAFALVAFSGFALVVLDRAQTSALDDRLSAAARATSAFMNESDGGRDPIDTTAFARILGIRVGGALLDSHGRLIASTARDLPDGIFDATAAANGPQTIGRGDDAVRVVRFQPARPRGRVATIVIWTPLANVGDLVRRVAVLFAIAVPAFVLISFALGRLIARGGLRPLRAVVALAGEIEATDLSRRLPLAVTPGELGELCATFDRMLDRLEAAFERERRFSADASHELRAPLSILRAEAELALARERNGDAYRAALRSIVGEADALEALARDLLRAARAEPRLPDALGAIDLAAVVRRAVDAADRLAVARGVTIVRDVAQATVSGDSAALERATLALLDNAIKYARQNGIVRVVLERTSEEVRLTVCDDGFGFTVEALRSATQRFWRDRGDRSQPGTGLGLAIARTSIEASGGSFTLSNAESGGACVSACFTLRS